jgi:ADP-ribosyl-[dinitrogen reductase] hydrolase
MELAERLGGAVWGHLVGDAVGVPYEFRDARQITKVRWGERGTHGQPPGTWSDDGALMLALLDSLLEKGFDTADQALRALAWYSEGHYTPDGDGRFDVGGTTSAALRRFASGVSAEEAGPADERSCGNGSLMRILPLALVERESATRQLVEHAHRASRVTHGHPRPQVACALYVLIARGLLAGRGSRAHVLAQAREELRRLYLSDDFGDDYLAALDHLEGWREREGRGRVWDSFWSAWDALDGADSYRETIERAVRYGNDTDTTAAIAGGLAGIRWGIGGIPAEWLSGMRGGDIVQPLVARLLASAGYRTDAIRVDWVDLATVPGLRDTKGALGMTFLPGKRGPGQAGEHWRDLESDAAALRNVHAVDTLLLLVEDHELERAQVPTIEAVMAEHGIELLRHPVVDMDVPTDPDAFREVLGEVGQCLETGRRVAVACMGGLGRTGTAVACLLIDAGLDAEAAITVTRASRRETIETHAQEQFVHRWPSA